MIPMNVCRSKGNTETESISASQLVVIGACGHVTDLVSAEAFAVESDREPTSARSKRFDPRSFLRRRSIVAKSFCRSSGAGVTLPEWRVVSVEPRWLPVKSGAQGQTAKQAPAIDATPFREPETAGARESVSMKFPSLKNELFPPVMLTR